MSDSGGAGVALQPAPTGVSVSPTSLTSRAVLPALAVTAGCVHLAVAGDHGRDTWVVGVAFVTVGVLQLALAVALARAPRPSTVMAGLSGTVVVVVLYVASRTVGLPLIAVHEPGDVGATHPLGAEVHSRPSQASGTIEPVGALDLVALLAELSLVAGLASMLPAAIRSRALSLLLWLGLGAVLARASGLLA